MFDNIGKTLYKLGKILFWFFLAIGILFSLFWMFFGVQEGDGVSFMLGISGLTSAFIFALPICGFGKLIQDVEAIKNKISDK